MLGLTVVGFLCGFTFIVGLLDPYSAYGRVVVHIFKPIYMLGNNLLESLFARFDNYTFYQVDTSILSISSLLIAIITLCSHLCNGMEARTDLVQHDLSRRNNFRLIKPVFIIQSPY